jgi:hypothetical protein
MSRFKQACLSATAMVVAASAATPVSAASVTVLYQFSGRADGGIPSGSLLLDAAGNLYGTTLISGRGSNGVVFRLTPAFPGQKWTETVLYSFPRNHYVDTFANDGLLADASGALYGTAFGNDLGFAYRLAPPAPGGTSWRFSKIYSFSGLADGGGPSGPLSMTPFGQLVGVTQAGGDVSGRNQCDCGVAYTLSPPTQGGSWQESVAHTYLGRPDGNTPTGALATDADGALYGTTFQGGSGHCVDHIAMVVTGCGTVFRLSYSGSAWSQSILYNFQPDEGNFPTNSVVFGPDGALYGSAGPDVFRLALAQNGDWQKTTLVSFPHGIAGAGPTGGLIFDESGNIYGASDSTGLNGRANIFKITPPGSEHQAWTLTRLATLATNANGPQPAGGLARGPNGTLFGAVGSAAGATYGYIFEVVP